MNIRMIIVLVIILCFAGNAYSQTVKKVGSKLSPGMESFIQNKWCLVEYYDKVKAMKCAYDDENMKKFDVSFDYPAEKFHKNNKKLQAFCEKNSVVKFTGGTVSFEVVKENNTAYRIKPIMPNKQEINLTIKTVYTFL